ncbi:MAG: cysteine--tRNA ligase [Actinobacteria bacterium]|nr:cysteine--tRNA ligase [Actinomycetota bacterium]
MRIFNTATNNIEDFRPGPIVNIYTCGITPYDATHIGHAATYVTYDVLQRRLRDLGYETRCVRNVTDVDDDILRKARELGVHYLDLAAKETNRFNEDMSALEMIPCWSEPRATSAIAEIRKFVSKLLEKGDAYEVQGYVYFDISKSDDFGAMCGLDESTMLQFAAERGGKPEDPLKRNPLDFVLWQPSLSDEPAWESLWGPGRPGWHVECSVLAMRELQTETIDIHGGGADLIFPHHECERVQSESLTNKPFVRIWMHQAMVKMDGEKMSKSLGNLVFVSDLREKYDPRAIRLALTGHHYRHSWSWTPDLMEKADFRLRSWINAGLGDGGLEQVRNCLDDDLNTPQAVKVLDAQVEAGNGISEAAKLLGINIDRH